MNELRETIAEAFHEHRRHALRFLVPYVRFIDEHKQMESARFMAAAWVCLHDEHEKAEPYHFADKLIAELREKGLVP